MDVIEDKKIRDGCFSFVFPLTLPETFTKFRSRENFIHIIIQSNGQPCDRLVQH